MRLGEAATMSIDAAMARWTGRGRSTETREQGDAGPVGGCRVRGNARRRGEERASESRRAEVETERG